MLDLPDQYSTATMLREIDESSNAETAAVLELTEQNVSSPASRAMMRDRLFARVGVNGKYVSIYGQPL